MQEEAVVLGPESASETRAPPALPAATAAPPPACLAGGGEMGAIMRAIDWSRTPLGPLDGWPLALRMMVSFLLANRFPLLLWWGPEFCQLYNDAYRPVLGTKHPNSMGQPARECWPEIWHIIGPLIETPFSGGPATWMEDIPLEVNRHGFVEETHFTIAYSPVPDDTASRGIGGVLATVHEITEKVVAERRGLVLRDLGALAMEGKSAEEACATAAAALGAHAKDIPFAVIYLLDADGKRAHLACSAGVEPGEAVSPRMVPLEPETLEDPVWHLAEVVRTGAMATVEDLAERFGTVPPGPWSDPPRSAAVIPIRSNKPHKLAGFLVAGVSPRLRFDDLYRSFLELVAGQFATIIANARAYEEERSRAEALAEIDRAKTAFFTNVSHEFRTPLTLMLGPLEDALAAPAKDLPDRRADLALAHRNGQRLLRLVNTLLDFSRIEAGRVQASFEPVDLAALTADLASVFRAATDKAGLSLAIDCPPLPERVWVDREMWEKIVLNLLSNAFKFTLEGGIAVRLGIAGGQAVLTVEDTGTGIPAHELPHLFDRFHRVEGARGRTHEGTGIGLALVHELARLHGGSVGAESTLGKGSRFTVSIPLGEAHLPSDRLRAERTLASTAIGAQPFVAEAMRWLTGAGASEEAVVERLPAERLAAEPETAPRPTVLLADDNADMRDYVRRLLAGRYQVRTAADGAAALAAARERRPDLLLSDVMMPRLDGFGLLREIRADPVLADLPVILLSARAGEEASIEGLEAGADDYLIKPFTARELLARVGATLKMATLRSEAERALRELNNSLEQKVEARTRALESEMIERHKVEAALQQVRRLEAVGQLTGGIAHDFNNLLTVVLSLSESIAMAAHGNERITRMAATTQRAAERGAQLTSQLLSFSGKQQLRPITVVVDGLVRSAGDLVRRTIGETITMTLTVARDLWPAHLDPAQLESAILNLAINARDAMPGGGNLVITARNRALAEREARQLDIAPGDYVVVSVTDTGTGMTPEVRRRAFEPFFTTKEVGKGTGLGLSQIYGFMRQSGGTASIDSSPGIGTTVSLYFPRAGGAVAERPAMTARRERGAGCGRTVLVVEDQPDVRDVIEMSLAELDYRVLVASDGVAAQRLLNSTETIDLLLTDVVMPGGVSGLDLAQDARRLRQDIKVVVVSGFLRGERRTLERAGLIFLEKPFLPAELTNAVAAALAGKASPRTH